MEMKVKPRQCWPRTLRRNLAQIISRKLVNEPDVVAYDPLIGSKTKEPHKEGWEKGKAAAMDNKAERERVRAGFPTFGTECS